MHKSVLLQYFAAPCVLALTLLALSARAQQPSPSAPVPVPVPRFAQRDPALDVVLARVAEYVKTYAREAPAVVAEEVYEQRVMASTLGPGLSSNVMTVPQGSRKLKSDFLLVKVPGADTWLPFRDVFEVDGKKVRERDDRLQKLFINAPTDKAIKNANAIWEESASYNIGPIRRNLNVPTLPLMFVEQQNVSRFRFVRRGEQNEAGVRAWVVEYHEIAKPTIIKTTTGDDVPASGRLWVEPANGRIVRTTMDAGGANITVTYRPYADIPGVWLPASMDERYGTTVHATATYSNFRRFRVFTEEHIKVPKVP